MSKARREGTCVICHNDIKIGEEINHYQHGSAHETCIGGKYVEGDVMAYRRRGKRRPGGKFKQ